MTEKRFVGNFQGKMLVSIKDKENNCNVNILQIVEIANKLSNEKEQLKQSNLYLQNQLEDYATVESENIEFRDENEQLKKKCENYKQVLLDLGINTNILDGTGDD